MSESGESGAHDADVWVLAQGVIDDHRVILRQKRRSPVPDPQRPVRVTIKIGFADPRSDGFPRPVDVETLEAAEETLIAELAQRDAEVVLIVTANNAREFIAYAPTHEWLEEWGPTVLTRWANGRPGTGVDAELEPDWETYQALRPAARG